MNISVLPVILFGLDFVWFMSSLILLLLLILVLRSFTKLVEYPGDRRRHSFPLQAIVIVGSGLILACSLVFWVTGHQPPEPLFRVPGVAVIGAALIYLVIVLGQVVFQRRPPLTKNQKRYRRVAG